MPFLSHELVLFWALELSLTALLSLVVAWLVLRPAAPLVKAAVLTAILVPLGIGANHDYVLIQLIHLSIVVIPIGGLALVRRLVKSTASAASVRTQFSIIQLLTLTLLVGLAALEARFVKTRDFGLRPVLIEGFLDGSITLWAICVFSRVAHRVIRLVALLAFPLALCFLVDVDRFGSYAITNFFGGPNDALYVSIFIVSQAVFILLGFALARQIEPLSSTAIGARRTAPQATSNRPVVAWIAGALLLILAPGCILWAQMALTFRVESAWPVPDSAYNRLSGLARKLAWDSLPNQDADEATADERRAFVDQNRNVIKAMRALISPELHTVVDYTSLSIAEIQDIRSIARALYAAGMYFQEVGDWPQATEIRADCIELGVRISNGGLVIDSLIGSAVSEVGTMAVFKSIDRLDSGTCQTLMQRIRETRQALEPFSEIMRRELRWQQTAYGWHGQANVLQERILGTDVTASFEGAHDRLVTSIALLEGHAAVRAYQLAEERLPDSWSDLVPRFLNAPPRDGFHNLPLALKREGEQYLLYSFGSDGIDDSGRIDIESSIVDTPDYRLEVIVLQEEQQKAEEAAEAANAAQDPNSAE
jgi:hypothetical protein